MDRSAWTVASALLIGLVMTASGVSGAAKPMPGVELRRTAAFQGTSGQEKSPTSPPPTPNPDGSGKYHIGDGVSAPQIIYSVDPEFTDQARRKKLSGTCVIGMLVDVAGTPQHVHTVRSMAASAAPKLRSAASSLDANAVKAAKQYRFKPATYQGKAVPVETTVEINYRIF
jgi:TonB family protein